MTHKLKSVEAVLAKSPPRPDHTDVFCGQYDNANDDCATEIPPKEIRHLLPPMELCPICWIN